jgi:hypothetical protein
MRELDPEVLTMPKDPATSEQSATLRAFLEQDANPEAIVDDYVKKGDVDSPFWSAYVELRTRFLAREGEAATGLAQILDRVDNTAGFETAVRNAGFVLGFEYCRRLLTGGAR